MYAPSQTAMIENCSNDQPNNIAKYWSPFAAILEPCTRLSIFTKGTGKNTNSLYKASSHNVMRSFCLITFERQISANVFIADLIGIIQYEIEGYTTIVIHHILYAMLPPAASIFSFADAENAAIPWNVNFFVNSPFPRIFTLSFL